jgi:hypothetical protein
MHLPLDEPMLDGKKMGLEFLGGSGLHCRLEITEMRIMRSSLRVYVSVSACSAFFVSPKMFELMRTFRCLYISTLISVRRLMRSSMCHSP